MSFRGGYRHPTHRQGSPPIPWSQAFGWAMSESLKAISARQKALVGVRTGALRASIGCEPPRFSVARVEGVMFAGGAGSPYAKAHEYGTGLYSEAPDSKRSLIVIVPRHASALRWFGVRRGGSSASTQGRGAHTLKTRGAIVFAARVVQRGQQPRSYMRPGLEEAADEIMAYVAEAAGRVLGRR